MAVNVWRGTAADVKQVDTIGFTGVWTAGDLVYLAVNGSTLEVTVGTSTSVAIVAEILSNAINATSKTDNLQGDESRNFGSQELPELTEVSASNTATSVVVTGNTSGSPFTVTVPTPTTAGSGDATLASTASCTGRQWWDNASNWSQAAVPVTGDQIVFQDSEVDCLYGLEQSAVTNCTLQCDASYSGRIGLATKNPNGYDEYRTRHLQLGFAESSGSITIGGGPGSGSSRINIESNAVAAQMVVFSTGPAQTGEKAAVDFVGGADAVVSVRQGSVSLAAMSSNTASVATLEMTYNTQIATDATVYVGTQARVGLINKAGGNLSFINTDGGTISTCTNQEGVIEFNGAMTVTVLDVQGGQAIWNSTGTLGTPLLTGNGILDFSRDYRTKTVTNPVERYSGSSRVLDPNQVVSNLRIDNNQVADLSNILIGTGFRITRAATS